jgi:hypothetical protein
MTGCSFQRIGLRRTTLSLADFVASLTADHRQRLAGLISGQQERVESSAGH